MEENLKEINSNNKVIGNIIPSELKLWSTDEDLEGVVE